jgi:hypothetical protein
MDPRAAIILQNGAFEIWVLRYAIWITQGRQTAIQSDTSAPPFFGA